MSSTPRPNSINELYKETMLRHYRSPQHKITLQDPPFLPTATAEERRNCGDRIWIALRVSEGKVENLVFEGEGCSISIASASMACASLQGRYVAVVQHELDLVWNFLEELEFGRQAKAPLVHYPDLVALESLSQYPTRVACARLAWQALRKIFSSFELST